MSSRPRPRRCRSASRCRLAALAVPGLVLAGLLAGPAAATPVPVPTWSGYSTRSLELPPGAYSPILRAVDAGGDVLGNAYGQYDARSIWDTRGRSTLLPVALDGAEVLAFAGPQRVAGDAWDGPGQGHAVRWTDGVPTVIDPPGASTSQAQLINRSGQIAGLAWKPGQVAAFVWSPATGVRWVTPFVPDDQYAPGIHLSGLDDAGTVVGTLRWPLGSDNAHGTPTAFRWTPSSGLVDLLAAARARGDAPTGVTGLSLSPTGVVAVSAQLGSGKPGAWLVPPSGPAVDLLVGYPKAFAVVHVDTSGRVWGNIPWWPGNAGCPATDTHRGAVWDAAHGVQVLPTGTRCGERIEAANDVGEVVGAFDPGLEGMDVGFVWDARRGLRSLDPCDPDPNTFHVCPFSYAWGVSDGGHVLGSGWKETGHQVWDPPVGVARVVATDVSDTSVVPGGGRPLGSQPWLAAGGGAVALLRIAVPAPPAGRALVSATLQLRTTGATGAGTATPLEVRSVPGVWDDATTWSTRPALGTRRLGVFGVVAPNEPVSVRIDPADVPANGGWLELAVLGGGTDGVRVASREATDARLRPQVQLIYR